MNKYFEICEKKVRLRDGSVHSVTGKPEAYAVSPKISEQDELTEPIRAVIASVLGLDTTSLQIVNRPPTRSKPIYMKVWEARKADGLDYDPEDERQQAFLSEITKYNIRSIE